MKNNEVYDFINAFMGTSVATQIQEGAYGANNGKNTGWVAVKDKNGKVRKGVYEFKGSGDKKQPDVIMTHGKAEHRFEEGDRVKITATKNGGQKVVRIGNGAEKARESARTARQGRARLSTNRDRQASSAYGTNNPSPYETYRGSIT